ncbi:hypothetical protein EJ02DRAFT_25081 [Clathrospora elynae]|uniref:Uncharacterized protein n=1 Tax=Clathrospora elynae TaxID=706981 RepID=A0A6A5T258_9PLEO|nr:hypothetical protein EJ02DRAFT_25081 [Clathrospora elynae]
MQSPNPSSRPPTSPHLTPPQQNSPFLSLSRKLRDMVIQIRLHLPPRSNQRRISRPPSQPLPRSPSDILSNPPEIRILPNLQRGQSLISLAQRLGIPRQ